jgi:AcrR family transcriptional regulator
MVHITHCGENIEKIGDILDAAQKRFGLYGLEKTTMSEIAADLNMSKGSIYYYFPDKEKLYKAVVEKEHTEFLENVKERIHELDEPAEMLKEYLRISQEFFRSFLNLSRTRMNEIVGLSPFMKEIVTEQRTKEKVVLIEIFKKGSEMSRFYLQNHEDVAILFLDLIRGLRRMIIGKKEIFYLENKEYEVLQTKMNLFADIFLRGLTNK